MSLADAYRLLIEIVKELEAAQSTNQPQPTPTPVDTPADEPEPENATAAPKVSKAVARLRLRTSQTSYPIGRNHTIPGQHKRKMSRREPAQEEKGEPGCNNRAGQ